MGKRLILLIGSLFAASVLAGPASSTPPARVVTSYALTLVPDFQWYNPSAWRLLASNDGQSWTVLDVRTNENPNTGTSQTYGMRQVYEVANQTAYRSYRLQIDANSMQGPCQVGLAEIELLGPVVGVEHEADLQANISSSQEHPLLGSPQNAFDGDVGTRWIDFAPFAGGGCWIQCDYVRQAEWLITKVNQVHLSQLVVATPMLMVEKAQQIQSNLTASASRPARPLTGYALTSANDYPNRDPHDWQLLGSNDGGKMWDTLDERRNEIFSSRFQRRIFLLEKPAQYSLYRMQFHIKESSGMRFQLGDLEPLYGKVPDQRPESLVILASAENPPMEKADMAFDGDPRSKWLCFVPSVNTPLWIQWQAVPQIDGLPIINLREFHLSLDRSRPHGQVPPLGNLSRTLTSYSLTSAEDSAERDPADWRLLGSNDGGNSWITLDERHNQVFTERSQKREFILGHPQACALYRFQVDSVASPANANSVQLAKIAPVYAPEASNPSSAIVISARGEHPPREKVDNLFSDNPQTKWLDFSPAEHHASWVQWYFANTASQPVIRADSASGIQPGFPSVVKVRLDGVAICATSNLLGFLDESGLQLFRADTAGLTVDPGQRVRLTGRIHFGNGFPELQHPAIQPLGSLLQIGQAHSEQIFDYPQPLVAGSAEGRVLTVAQGPDYTTVELAPENGAHSFFAKILNPGHAAMPNFANCRLRVQGVVQAAYDETGSRISGIIWVSSLANVALARPAEKDWDKLPSLSLENLADLSPGQPMLVSGVVQQQVPGQKVVISQGTHQLSVYSSQTNSLPVGSRVDAAGFLANANGVYSLNLSYVCLASDRSHARPETQTAATTPGELTSIRQVVEAIRNTPNRVFKVKVRGVITYIDLGLSHWYLQDGPDSIVALQQLQAGVSTSMHLEGKYVELEGNAGGNYGFGIWPTAFIKVLGRGHLPTPLRHSWDYLMTGADDGKWVQLEGIITEFEKQRLTLRTADGELKAWVNDIDPGTQDRLLGGLVRVNGVCTPVINNRHQRMGIRLLVPSPDSVEMIKAGPQDPFDLPEQSISSLMQYDDNQAALPAQLVKITGVVTYQEPHQLFVQNDTNALRIVPRQEASVAPGDTVEAVGLTEMDGLSPKLVQAVIHVTGHAALPPANPIDLLGADADKIQATVDATRGSTEATLLGRSFNESLQVLQLKQDKSDKTFLAYLPIKDDVLATVPVGSHVRLEGAFKAKTDSIVDFGQVITSFEMFLNSPADVVVLQRPPWWTSRRVLWVLGGACASMIIAMAWATLLRLQVRRRTRELQAEMSERKRMETELMAASRQAGMAEVATSVLHNVGNVLNSVNISSGLIADKLRESRTAKLSQVAALLTEHAADLGHFLTQDTRGRHIPSYLAKLADKLESERATTVSEMDALRQNIDHIKQIVARQQTYASSVGVTEIINVTELIEEALRINSVALSNHGINVMRQYDPELPQITVDRHKVLQILINVVTNARHACVESPRPDKQIRVQAGCREGQIRISVTDNGVGIAPENITRIFTHGFTTRSSGHGFGLHGSALAAQEMGGTLAAQSEGPGKGATFILQLPV
jgi:signal transduction histidine kinase